ncbi:MAG TPA: extracellular solute-binding protein [Beijerinckiaceae bacterium]|jgi:ABC-type Fe3+ transport system substrate-binding protein|nr:extracellular solute-binding protein [Beijerinckiaceae bacterium]
MVRPKLLLQTKRGKVALTSLSVFAAVFVGFLQPRPALALTDAEILTYSGPDRDQVLLEGAKKEGQVVLYSGIIVNQALRPIADAFSKKYPFLKLTYVRADSEEIVPKLQAEERAGKVVADLVEATGAGEEAIGAGLVQPFASPILKDYPDKYHDPRNLWMPTRMSYFGIAYNTKLVAKDTLPKTYDDLLDPKWRGKIVWPVGATSSANLFLTNLRVAWGEDKAMDYFKKLAQQKLINFGSGTARTVVDRVLAGEYPMALAIYAHHPLISKAKGAPVDTLLLDPVASAAGGMVVPKGLPHPYSAMLLVDFLLSKEGQEILAKAEYFPARPDVPALPMLAPIVPQNAGFSENYLSPQVLYKDAPGSDKILQDLFR